MLEEGRVTHGVHAQGTMHTLGSMLRSSTEVRGVAPCSSRRLRRRTPWGGHGASDRLRAGGRGASREAMQAHGGMEVCVEMSGQTVLVALWLSRRC